MNLLLVITGFSLLALAWTVLATGRMRQHRRRIRVRFRARPVALVAAMQPCAVMEAPLPVQLSLFDDLRTESAPWPALMKTPAAGAVTLAPDHKRRGYSATGPRLDWEYFNKDAGDLADPSSPPRMRPSPAISLEEQPARRA